MIIIRPKIDVEFASLIPPLSAKEYMQLESSILVEGCRNPLVIWGGILIDGHNRLRICEKHSIQFEVADVYFSDRDDAKKYIILNQIGRNLSVSNRCLLALKLEPLYKVQAKSNQQRSLGRGKKGTQNSAYLFSKMHTDKMIAKIAGVSHDTIYKVKRIVEYGTPEQLKRIKEGGKGNSVSAVFDEVRRTSALATENASDHEHSLISTSHEESRQILSVRKEKIPEI